MPSCVVLLSGGLDSATTLAIARSQGYDAHALTVLYGQRHVAEVDAAKRVAIELGAAAHKFISVELNAIGGSALTDDIAVPKLRSERMIAAEIPATYVPARNTVLLALALGYAEVIGAQHIFVGVNAVDYSGYPDCRPEFIRKFEELAQIATKAGVEGRPIEVHAPLVQMSKPEIIRAGLALGVDYSLTHSCYDPDRNGRACCQCDSCIIRASAFEEVGIPDPALAPVNSGTNARSGCGA